jgi:putative endonuclease
MDCRNESGNDKELCMYEDKVYCVYLLASKPYGTLYIGVTSNIVGRTTQHRDGVFKSFTKKYGIHRLVWFEEFGDIHLAIQREKTMKHWSRQWKINLIEQDNPHWEDLYQRFFATGPRLI